VGNSSQLPPATGLWGLVPGATCIMSAIAQERQEQCKSTTFTRPKTEKKTTKNQKPKPKTASLMRGKAAVRELKRSAAPVVGIGEERHRIYTEKKIRKYSK